MITTMGTAQKILVVSGTIVLGYGLLLGVFLAAARSSSVQASRHLVSTHLSAMIQGGIFLGLAFAFGAAGFTSTAATVAAVLLVGGGALEAAGGTANWIGQVTDQFAERSIGYRLNAASCPPMIVGMAIVIVGVVAGL